MKSVKYYLYAAAVWLIVAIIFAPCVLLFTEGSDGQFTIWNVVGLVYTFLLIFIVKRIISKK